MENMRQNNRKFERMWYQRRKYYTKTQLGMWSISTCYDLS